MNSNENNPYVIILQLFNKQEFGRLETTQKELLPSFLERVREIYEFFHDEDIYRAWQFESIKQNKIYTFEDKITMSQIVEQASEDIFVFKEDYTFGICLKYLLQIMEVKLLETQETCSFDQIREMIQNEQAVQEDEEQSDKNATYNTQSLEPHNQIKQIQKINEKKDTSELQINSNKDLIQEANYALSIEEYLEALGYSIKVLATNHNNIEAIIILGKALFGLLKYKSSVICYDFLLNILIDNLSEEQHCDILIQKGASISRLRKYKEALDLFEKAQKMQKTKNSFLENEISNAKTLLEEANQTRSPQIEKKVHL